jgi:hypothetical protein
VNIESAVIAGNAVSAVSSPSLYGRGWWRVIGKASKFELADGESTAESSLRAGNPMTALPAFTAFVALLLL